MLSCIPRINYGGHTEGVKWEGRGSNLDLIPRRHTHPVVFYFCTLKEKDIFNWLRGRPDFRCFPTDIRLPLRCESYQKEHKSSE